MKTKEQKRKEAKERAEKYAALSIEEKIAIAGEKQLRKKGWTKQ